MLPDSLIARASFTHGFPHYPYPNLPMTLRSVVNRCANSEHIIGAGTPWVNGLGLRILHISERKIGRLEAIPRSNQDAWGVAPGTISSMIIGSSGMFSPSPLVGT